MELRTKTRTHLKSFLPDNSAKNAEKSIYNFTIRLCTDTDIEKSWENDLFKYVYVHKSLHVINNLKNNPSLVNHIIVNKSSKEIAFVDPDMLKYDYTSDVIHDDEDQNNDIIEGLFKCPRCKGKKTTYYSVQTRSADEPMTNFITCLTCKNRWKN